jgi:hypothetical protein
VKISSIYTVTLISSHPPFHFHSLSPFPNSILWVLLCCVHMYICSILWFSSPLRVLSFLLPLLTDLTRQFSKYSHVIIVIIINVLGPGSTNEREDVIFGFLSLAYLTQHDDFLFHLFSFKWYNFIFLYGWGLFHDTHAHAPYFPLSTTPWLSPQFGYCEGSYNKHEYAVLSLVYIDLYSRRCFLQCMVGS